MLALDRQAFDQNPNGGWRALARRAECREVAADLIRDYREQNRLTDGILYWHEGQLRAALGDTTGAIALFERSRRQGTDNFGWNHYVDATIAFLTNNREGLIRARDALAAMPRPQGFAPTDPSGNPIQMSWPPNLHVVEAMLACFGRTYSEAYSGCRSRP